MIKTLDETITFYKKKYEILRNYDNLKAEEYKELSDWLIDYKRLKAKEEAKETFDNMLYDVLKINKDECLSDKAVMNILNDKELTEETQKEIDSILEKRNQKNNRYNMIKEAYKKLEDNSINKKDIQDIKECIYKNR